MNEDNNEFEAEDTSFEEAPVEEKKVFNLPHTIELQFPVMLSDKITKTQIVFKKRLEIGMMKHIVVGKKELQIGHYLPMIAAMTCEPQMVIERLDPVDFSACAEVMASFL